jgi:DNA-binding SARP family transcriptional activator
MGWGGAMPGTDDPFRASRLSLRLLGRAALFAGGTAIDLSPGATMLVAYLALAPDDGRARSTAAAQLFADCPETAARRRFNTALWRLQSETRAKAGADLVVRRGARRVGLDSDVGLVVDVAVFDDLVSPVLRHDPANLTQADTDRLMSAVDIHRGPLLQSCNDDDWVLTDRYRIENLYLTALDYLIQHYGTRGEIAAITRYGQLALDVEPLREDVHRHLMKAYAAVGRIDLAESQFERCRLLLRRELGTDPMPETMALRLQIVQRRTGDEVHFAALVTELEHARVHMTRLTASVDRALDQLRNLR